MTQPFSFPYPQNGTTPRPAGQGCKTCVHGAYCQALYWFRRYTLREPDNHNGILCASWSSNMADQVKTHNQRDMDEVEYIWNQGIGSEANRCGIVDEATGSWRRP